MYWQRKNAGKSLSQKRITQKASQYSPGIFLIPDVCTGFVLIMLLHIFSYNIVVKIPIIKDVTVMWVWFFGTWWITVLWYQQKINAFNFLNKMQFAKFIAFYIPVYTYILVKQHIFVLSCCNLLSYCIVNCYSLIVILQDLHNAQVGIKAHRPLLLVKTNHFT